MSTLKELLANSVTKNKDKLAVIIPDGPSVSFQTFSEYISSVQQQLKSLGSKPGDVISIVLSNGLPFLVTFLAVTNMKCIAAPLNAAYKIDDFTFYLKDTESKLVLVPGNITDDQEIVKAAKSLSIPLVKVNSSSDGKVALESDKKSDTEHKESIEEPSPSDVALFLHTSGTTSLPKGVPLTHENLSTSVQNIIKSYALTPEDCSLIVMPLFHVHGLLGATLSTLFSGGTIVVPPRFSATTFWDNVTEHNVTWYSAVPTIHQILLIRAETHPIPKGKLRFIRSCSSPLAPSVYETMLKTFGVPVLEAYGMTEASHQMASNPLPSVGPAKVGTVGIATNVEVSVRDDHDNSLAPEETGEICIRGKNVTKGYHNRPEANTTSFTATGWFRTGDQGFLDKEGYLTITGRIKELINRGGEKISPVELDGILLSHPNVADAVSFAAPDEKYGEQVNCAVIPREGATVTEEDVMKYCKEKVADFKVPVKVFVTDQFPRTATGKIQRRHVAEYFLKKKA